MSTGVTSDTLHKLHRMTDVEFSNVLLTLASFVLPPLRASRLLSTAAILGIRTRVVQLESVLNSNIAKWLSRGIFGGTASYQIFAYFIKTYIEKLTGEILEDIDKESVLQALGRFVAKKMREELLKRYAIYLPIDTVYPINEFIDKLGIVLAGEANKKAGKVIFTSFMPPDKAVHELDAFITDELNLKLGINISGLIFNHNLMQELKAQLINSLQQELINNFASAKGKLINRYALEGGAEADKKMQLLAQTMNDALILFSSFSIDNFAVNSKAYYSNNKHKIHNKMRQREYRLNHREVRHWVHK